MEKFISIPVVNEANESVNQLISATQILLIEQTGPSTISIYYKYGGSMYPLTIEYLGNSSSSEQLYTARAIDSVSVFGENTNIGEPSTIDDGMRIAIQNAVVSALQTSSTNVSYTVSNLPFTVSSISFQMRPKGDTTTTTTTTIPPMTTTTTTIPPMTTTTTTIPSMK